MMKKTTIILVVLGILIPIVILIVLGGYLLNIFRLFSYHENHNVQKGESSLYKYFESNHCFSNDEKQMISDRFKLLDVFTNEIFYLSDCGDLRISFDVKDYDAEGSIYLYSNSSFENLKKWVESNNHNSNISVYNTWLSILDDDGEISFYKNKDSDTFRIIYITRLPYIYKVNEINKYSVFVRYFLELNQKNMNK